MKVRELTDGLRRSEGVAAARLGRRPHSQGDRRYRRRVLKSLRSGLGGYMRRTKLINRVLRAQEPPRVAVAAVLVPVLRREVHRQKRATGASRSGKAAGQDDVGTLTSGAVPFCGTHLIWFDETLPRCPHRVRDTYGARDAPEIPGLSRRGTDSSNPSPSSSESCKPSVPQRDHPTPSPVVRRSPPHYCSV